MNDYKTFTCSDALRWYRPNNSDLSVLYQLVLQQAWTCVETGEVDWRDVPLVDDSKPWRK